MSFELAPIQGSTMEEGKAPLSICRGTPSQATSNITFTNYSIYLDMPSPQAQLPPQPQQQTQLQIEEEVDMSMLREREQAIRKIESDIVEVNQIFKDLATMVHDQGEVIDSIEANIESSSIQIHEGTQQLIKASDYSVCFPCDRK